jgi:metal-responsive CopG/Arc/MetJ family transcriptional regulator
MTARTVRTTVAISASLLEAVDAAVREGKVDSRNEFVETALRHELAALRRAAIDAEFSHMATDRSHQREATQIAEELEFASWDALRTAEGDT